MGVFDILPGVGGAEEPEQSGDSTDDGREPDGPGRSADLTPSTFRDRAETLAGRSDVPTLDFTVESLERLDDLAAGPSSPVDDRVAYGSYLGETLVRTFDAEWTDDDGWQVAVPLPDDRTTLAVFDAAKMSIAEEPVFSKVVERLEAEGARSARSTSDAVADEETETEVFGGPDAGVTDAADGPADADATTGDDPVAVKDGEDDAGTAPDDDAEAPDDGPETASDDPASPVVEGTAAEPADEAEPSDERDVDTASDGADGAVRAPDGDAADDGSPAVEDHDDGAVPSQAADDGPAESPDDPADLAGSIDDEDADGTEVPGDDARPTGDQAVAGSADAATDLGTDPETADDDAGFGGEFEPVGSAADADSNDDADVDQSDTDGPREAPDEPLTASADPPRTEPDDETRGQSDDGPRTESDEEPDSKPLADDEPDSAGAVDAPLDEPGTESAVEGAAAESTTAVSGADGSAEADGPDGDGVGPTAADERSDADDDGVAPADDANTVDAVEAADDDEANDPTNTGPPDRYRLRAAAMQFADAWSSHDLDFTPESISRLDAFVDDQWGGRFRASSLADRTVDHDDDGDPLTQLGAYYGEILVRELDGEWVWSDDGEGAVAVPDVGERAERVDVYALARTFLVEPAAFAYEYDALVNRLHADAPTVSEGTADVYDGDRSSLTSSDVITQFADEAEQLVDAWSGYNLDYSPRSLPHLDELVATKLTDDDFGGVSLADSTDPLSLRMTAHATTAGAYYSAVLVRHLDAQWHIDGEVELVVDSAEGETTVDPVGVAAECLRGETSFTGAFESITE